MSSDTQSGAAAGSVATNSIRTALGVGGLVALVVGILILVWPVTVIAVAVGIYAIVAGVVYIGIGLFSRARGGWSRVGHIVLGVLFVIAGILVFVHPGVAAASLTIFIGVLVGILWIIEGVVSLSTLGATASRGWTVFFAVISIIAGIVVLTSPLIGGLLLWLVLGVSLVVLGIVQIVRAITYRSA